MSHQNVYGTLALFLDIASELFSHVDKLHKQKSGSSDVFSVYRFIADLLHNRFYSVLACRWVAVNPDSFQNHIYSRTSIRG